MNYQVSIRFQPLHETMSSLHTYICTKSHKKIDLSSTWAPQVRERLEPDFAELLEKLAIDQDWKLTFLLVHLCPVGDANGFVYWLQRMSLGELYEMMAPYTTQFPADMLLFRERTATVFTSWQNQYFNGVDPVILERLKEESQVREAGLAGSDTRQFVDETTNGLVFEPIDGLQELILIPQMHFQPVNIISHYHSMTICYYSARVYPGDDQFLSPHEYRMIRSLGEKSRLKILRFLYQGPRSFIEIVRHLQLSKGITHDHISKLRSAGLIHAHFEGETLTVYSLREGATERLQESLNRYIQGM